MLRKDFDEILSGELISLTGGLFTGFMLTFATNKLDLIPALFILFPGFMEMRGNISGSLASRIASGLYVGVMKHKLERRKIIIGNVIAAFLLVTTISLFLGMLAYYVGLDFFGIDAPNIIMISLVAGLISNAIEIPLTLTTTLSIFKRGHDPNNIMGPYVTSTGDIISVFSLLIAIAVIA